jgi:aspartate/methionine/tyrosine aminotransferase
LGVYASIPARQVSSIFSTGSSNATTAILQVVTHPDSALVLYPVPLYREYNGMVTEAPTQYRSNLNYVFTGTEKYAGNNPYLYS